MKFKNNRMLPLVVIIFLLIGYIVASKPIDRVSLLGNLPQGWMNNLEIQDYNKCYSVNVRHETELTSDLEQYVKIHVLGRDSSSTEPLTKEEKYGINSSNFIDLGQTGVGNISTIYFKNIANHIYMIEINDIRVPGMENLSCPDLKPLVKYLVTNL